MTKLKTKAEVEEEFDKFIRDETNWFTNLGQFKWQNLQDFIHSIREADRLALYEIAKECVLELGHQQDDDSIWCNMDNILAALEKKFLVDKSNDE